MAKTFNSKEEMINYYSNPKFTGANGAILESLVKFYLKDDCYTGYTKAGQSDTVINRNPLEIKTGCGWLRHPYADKATVLEDIENDVVIKKATWICYLPKLTDAALDDCRVYTKKQFIQILKECGLIRLKAESSTNMRKAHRDEPLYGIAIQTWDTSRKKMGLFLDLLYNNGMTLEEFKIERENEQR